MASYSKELKDSITTRLITGETSASDLARETGISLNTIYRWRDKAKKAGISSTTKFKSADKCAPLLQRFLSNYLLQISMPFRQ
jgi:transposase-like protein